MHVNLWACVVDGNSEGQTKPHSGGAVWVGYLVRGIVDWRKHSGSYCAHLEGVLITGKHVRSRNTMRLWWKIKRHSCLQVSALWWSRSCVVEHVNLDVVDCIISVRRSWLAPSWLPSNFITYVSTGPEIRRYNLASTPQLSVWLLIHSDCTWPTPTSL